jgi:hypothetical protein
LAAVLKPRWLDKPSIAVEWAAGSPPLLRGQAGLLFREATLHWIPFEVPAFLAANGYPPLRIVLSHDGNQITAIEAE